MYLCALVLTVLHDYHQIPTRLHLHAKGLPIGWTCPQPGSVKDTLDVIYPWLRQCKNQETPPVSTSFWSKMTSNHRELSFYLIGRFFKCKFLCGKFPLGLVHQKRPPQVPKKQNFPCILSKILGLVGAFFGGPTRVEN